MAKIQRVADNRSALVVANLDNAEVAAPETRRVRSAAARVWTSEAFLGFARAISYRRVRRAIRAKSLAALTDCGHAPNRRRPRAARRRIAPVAYRWRRKQTSVAVIARARRARHAWRREIMTRRATPDTRACAFSVFATDNTRCALGRGLGDQPRRRLAIRCGDAGAAMIRKPPPAGRHRIMLTRSPTPEIVRTHVDDRRDGDPAATRATRAHRRGDADRIGGSVAVNNDAARSIGQADRPVGRCSMPLNAA